MTVNIYVCQLDTNGVCITKSMAIGLSAPVMQPSSNSLFLQSHTCACVPLVASLLQMDILCTHPMFGPDSGSGSWKGLNFMFEKVRIGPGANRRKRVDAFLQASRVQLRLRCACHIGWFLLCQCQHVGSSVLRNIKSAHLPSNAKVL